jgi:MtN3 and saliva related transmembrane protein
MMEFTLPVEVILGWTASILCTLILVPQIIKALKTRHTDDVSMYMLIISVAGNAFWVAHATMTKNMPLIVGAGLITVMSITLIIFKFIFDSK